ncbi:HTH-type transcriptional regulator MalT [bioreactor metagenome]|uniref:HTH-type transcriptional regulator MalT n=1 Tax=bioreactor metagenome TaxID=1076179 RepID=A0A644Y9F6_9ZZZZ
MDAEHAESLEQLGFPNDSVTMQEALRLIGEMALSEEAVLVLDDYHLVSATDVSGFVYFLIVSEIEHLHIILTARFVERFRIEELSLKGYLYHIEKDFFELAPGEIAEYYKLCGVNLRPEEADRLYRLTEGWISALYLLLLSFRETGSLADTNNIQKLVESAIYEPFSPEIKEFLLSLCLFDNFTLEQAGHMWSGGDADALLAEVRRKNAFITFDAETKTYQMHNIFTGFLRERLSDRPADYRRGLYEKAGQWCLQAGDYLTAMHHFHAAEDYDSLLYAAELDKTSSFGAEKKALIIRYFEECPSEYRKRHPMALLVYAMALVTFNETVLFQNVCLELTHLIQSGGLDDERGNELAGELELLTSFGQYNDIMGMSEHHKRACALLKKPSGFMDTTGSWTFGSPSVLYMFYRESGMLEQEIRDMKEAMPYYYRLTDGHGTGAEHLMEAERHFNRGDAESAKIAMHRALYLAEEAKQPNMLLCGFFLQARMALSQGDYALVQELLRQIHETVESNRQYVLIHTVDLCRGFIDSCLGQKDKIPEWLAEGDFNSSRLFFPARAFYNIIYGRALLLRGDYAKLLGLSGQFFGIASVFPSVLANVYTHIYVGVANQRLHRMAEALGAIRQALVLAAPDEVWMPFVENGEEISPILDALLSEGVYREDIARIRTLHVPYQKALEDIQDTHFNENKPNLTEREVEIAHLAAEGCSNREIGARLFISENTVKKYLKSVFEKLGVSSRSLLGQHLDPPG